MPCLSDLQAPWYKPETFPPLTHAEGTIRTVTACPAALMYLFTYAKLLDNGPVSLYILRLEIIEKSASLAYQFEQAPA